MPLYTYKCTVCGHEFDELVKYDDRDTKQKCKECGKEAERKVAVTFGFSSTLDPKRDTIATNKEIDMVVGAAAEKKWAGYDERWKKKYEQRQSGRWKGKEIKEVSLPKDGASPVMVLGDKKEQTVRKEFSQALQEHRAERVKKGLGQFDGPGTIDTK
jgi:putative FmdB family regulatory protein